MLAFNLALKNIKAYWKHSLASILAIASGFISICIFQGYVDDLSMLFHESISKIRMVGDIVIENKMISSVEGKANPYEFLISQEQQNEFTKYFNSSDSTVSNYVRFLSINGMISTGPRSTIFVGFGHDLEAGKKMRTDRFSWNTYFGIPLHLSPNASSILIGGNLANLLDCDFDNNQKFYSARKTWLIENDRKFNCKNTTVQLSANTVNNQFNAINLEISGIIDGNYKEYDAKYINMSLENAQTLFDTRGISFYGVKLKNKKSIKDLKRDLKNVLGDSINLYNITDWEHHQFGDIYLRNMDLFAIFRNFVLTIIVFVCGLSIFNTMLKIVVERHREIGTLRSIGYSRSHIQNIFMVEGALISIIGVSVGVICSLLFTIILNNSGIVYKAGMLTRPVSFAIAPSVSLYFASALVMIFISLFATYWALFNVQRKKIVECLTYA